MNEGTRDLETKTLIREGSTVCMHYVVKDASGGILDDTYAATPVRFVCGAGTFFPELERQIKGMAAGQKKAILVPAALGYGERKKRNTIKIRRSEVAQADCVVGGLLRKLNTSLESEIYTITGYVGEWLFLDKNHPWAGKDIIYDIHILTVEQGQSKTPPFRSM